MAGTEQGGKADKHGDLHVGFECPLSHKAGQDQTGVHSSRSRATSDPVAFHNKNWDQADFLSFSVKRPFQNEISLIPPNQDLVGCPLHTPGPSFAPP
jgi:hypothetical protein